MEPLLATVRQLFPGEDHDRIFLVGGAVRDLLLGHPSQDLDLVVALPPERLLASGFRPVATRSSVPIFFRHLPPLGNLEVTVISTADLLDDDLTRRDFTVNALAMDLTGRLHDPLGGRAHLHERLLVPCAPTALTDDPVRVFRAFRFEAEGWRLTPACVDLLSAGGWDFATIPVERFTREMLRALSAPGAAGFFRRLVEFGVGRAFLPELFRMAEIPAGPADRHPEGDLLSHSLQVLERMALLSDDATVRLCALFHDLGKLASDPVTYPRHHGHDVAGFATAGEFARRLRLSATQRQALQWSNRLHTTANRWDELRDATRIRLAQQAAKGGIASSLPLLVAADKGGAIILTHWETVLRVVAMNTAELGIASALLEGLPPAARPALILQKRVETLRSLQQF